MNNEIIIDEMWQKTLKNLEESMTFIARCMDNIDGMDKEAVNEHFGEPGYEGIAVDLGTEFDKICLESASAKVNLSSFIHMKRILDKEES